MPRPIPAFVILLSSCAAGFPPDERGTAIETREPLESERTIGDLADGLFELTPEAARDPEQLWIAGDQALRSGQLETAVFCFEKARAAAPTREAWKFERAQADALVALRRFDEAELLYRDLLRAGKPRDSTLEGNLAMACFRQGKLKDAREAAVAALGINPIDVEAAKTLGLVEIAQGAPGEGLARLEQAVARKPQIPEAQIALAEMESRGGRPDAALARYRQVLDWLPAALPRDYHRRWADLFFPSSRTTAQELQSRIASLERAQASSPVNPEKETQ